MTLRSTIRLAGTIAAVLPAAAGAAQTPAQDAPPIPAPAVTVLPTPAPTPVPDVETQVEPGVVLPTPSSAPKRRSPTSRVRRPVSPNASPTPVVDIPAVEATPDAAAIATPPRRATETGGPASWEPWAFGGAALVLLVILWARYRRELPAALLAQADEDAAMPPQSPDPHGARLVIALRPVRAGLNLVTAVADCDVTITNEGDAAAVAIRPVLALLAAGSDQRERIRAANDAPITRPTVPAFTLAPGETRTFRRVVSAQIDTLPTMQAGGREMMVPLVVVNVQHRDAEGVEHRTSQTFVLGVERVDSRKLAPFWMDSIRMIEQVAARTDGAILRRAGGRAEAAAS